MPILLRKRNNYDFLSILWGTSSTFNDERRQHGELETVDIRARKSMLTAMNIQPSLTTNRLSIKPLTITDAEFIRTLVNTEGWLKFIGNRNVNSQQEARDYIQKILENKNISYWVVYLKDNRIPVGVVTYIKRDYLEHPDIGFAFLPEFAKIGYAYEATQAVLNKLVLEQKPTRVLATTIPENLSSIRLLKKMGFEFEKEILVEKEMLHVYAAASGKLSS